MDASTAVKILLVEDNREFANLVQLFLRKHEGVRFDVTWRDNGPAALSELEKGTPFDLILMDYFLPGQNGLEITRELQRRRIPLPVVFLTVNKDFDLAVEVMKLGVEDYLVKEEITTPVLPKTILNVLERKKLREQLTQLEVSRKRLEAIQEMVLKISEEVRVPLDTMRHDAEELIRIQGDSGYKNYLTIIRDNLVRIDRKLTLLKELKTDKTIPYIRDIRMLDLSE
jgi:CheY-like chemotaxis protein